MVVRCLLIGKVPHPRFPREILGHDGVTVDAEAEHRVDLFAPEIRCLACTATTTSAVRGGVGATAPAGNRWAAGLGARKGRRVPPPTMLETSLLTSSSTIAVSGSSTGEEAPPSKQIVRFTPPRVCMPAWNSAGRKASTSAEGSGLRESSLPCQQCTRLEPASRR